MLPIPPFRGTISTTIAEMLNPRREIIFSADDWGVQSPKRNAFDLGSMKPFSLGDWIPRGTWLNHVYIDTLPKTNGWNPKMEVCRR